MRIDVAPAVLAWAQQRSGRSESEFHARFSRWDDWMTGDGGPTVGQLEKLAQFAHLPFGILLLPEPPDFALPIPDYRNGPALLSSAPSPDLLDVLHSSIRRQAWYHGYAERTATEPAAFDRQVLDDPVGPPAAAALRDLGYRVEDRRRMTREAARNHLRHAFERLGGLVVFSGMVGNDNHRMLARAEFRGFTLADDAAPFIFVNTHDDTLAGQIFTFFHEYGHVLLRRSGISDEDLARESGDRVERWCNAFAAEALVPIDDLREEYRGRAEPNELDRLASRYLCSTLVILLQLRRGNLVPREGFDQLLAAETRRAEQLARELPARSGGEFYANQPFRIGEKLSRAVLSDVAAGGTTYTEAFPVLGLRNVTQLARYSDSLGMG